MTAQAASRSLRARFLLVLAVVTPLGFGSKLYSGPGAAWASGQAGGFLYEVFWIFAVLAAFPRLSPARVSLSVAGVTSLLEVLQLWRPSWLEAVRRSFLGHALLGSTFAWSDFPYYAAGALAAGAGARWLALRAQPRASVAPRS